MTAGLNSTAKGDELEDKVYKLLGSLVEDHLGIQESSCKQFRKRSYHSVFRDGPINFENVVEVYSKTALTAPEPQPSLVLIFECKNYSGTVEVGEIEEFDSKLRQLTGFVAKGFLVSRVGFQRGALNVAKAKGIALIRIMPDGQYSPVMYNWTPAVGEKLRKEFPKRAMAGLTQPNYHSHEESSFGFHEGYAFPSLRDVVLHVAKDWSGTSAES